MLIPADLRLLREVAGALRLANPADRQAISAASPEDQPEQERAQPVEEPVHAAPPVVRSLCLYSSAPTLGRSSCHVVVLDCLGIGAGSAVMADGTCVACAPTRRRLSRR